MRSLLIGLGSGLAIAGVACYVADRFYFKRKYTVTPDTATMVDWSNPDPTASWYRGDTMYGTGGN